MSVPRGKGFVAAGNTTYLRGLLNESCAKALDWVFSVFGIDCGQFNAASSGQSFRSIYKETLLGESEEDLRLLAPSKKFILEVQAGRVDDPMIRQLSYGPSKSVMSYNGLIVNGYRFHTKKYGENKTTINSGVCVKGSIYGENDLDYYGILEEVLELSYLGSHKLFLFKCHWFDPTDGVKVDGKYGLVDVDYRSKLQSNESFILAEQAQQVYYTKFPVSGSRVNGEWWAACKVRAKLFMDETLNSVGEVSNEFSTFDYYQDDESLTIHDRTSEEEEINLLDAHGLMEEVNVDELPNSMNAPHTDQFIDDDEETDHNEFLDSDEELFDSDSSSDS
ncbi:uncharacterized protein G2W53_033475 [Senna tora]|uniref:DUF4216 domain-containing protein n=2 Tax=Senna tora TaxID=362788 RepID=A0A834SYK2_9FABA|nr:uncharacterized protein G2W53_033475 [Senna tora]